MAMVKLAEVNEYEPITFSRETDAKLERKKFSIKEKLVLLACLPAFPILFLLLMWSACYSDKKLEESGLYGE